VAFQESNDPLVENLQFLIDDLKEKINNEASKKILKGIDEKFPFVNLLEFIELFISGEYTKNLIEKFHLTGYSDYGRLLQILKLNKKRLTTSKNSISRNTNLSDSYLSNRYNFLQKSFSKLSNSILDRINYNVLRAVIILQLYKNSENFSNKSQIRKSIPESINGFEHLIKSPHQPLLSLDNKKIEIYTDKVLEELRNNSFIEFDNFENFRLEKHQLKIADYVFNIVQDRKDGITYEELLRRIKQKLPILFQTSPALIDITIHDLLQNNKLIRKEGYWKFKPYYDQYFTFENYRKLNRRDFYRNNFENKQFFGRKITPDQFIAELIELESGDFDDQDDQVTRIAGMILSNSNMMTLPPNELEEFDFTVDLSNYEFTKKQQEIIEYFDFEIRSQIIHVKVMINEQISTNYVENLITLLKQKTRNEQGFIISFSQIDESIQKILKQDKTIQIISKYALREWCKITPVIPARREAVAVIRQGNNQGNIVKIKSINYESGLADIVLFPDMKNTTHYIGSLEEIFLPVELKKFVEYSNIYFQFLIKLFLISQSFVFYKIVSNSSFLSSFSDSKPKINFKHHESIEYIFNKNFKSKIIFNQNLDLDSLIYSIRDLFSCTCFQWNEQSRTKGLCEHLIFVLNESIKFILSVESGFSENEKHVYLANIEKRMDLFLNRLDHKKTNDINQEIEKTKSDHKKFLDDLNPNLVTIDDAKNMRKKITVQGTVERKGEPRTVNMKSGGTIQVCDAFLIDKTGGKIKITLWGDEVEQVKDGDKVRIENGYTTSFKGEVSLATGKYGKLEVISNFVSTNLEND